MKKLKFKEATPPFFYSQFNVGVRQGGVKVLLEITKIMLVYIFKSFKNVLCVHSSNSGVAQF